jgi:hypothetical protein
MWITLRQIVAETKLREDTATTKGIITSRTPGMHGAVDYKFEVGGKVYHGSGGAGPQPREFGAGVELFYCRSDPAISSLALPVGRMAGLDWGRALVPVAIFCFAFSVVMGWIRERE